TWQRILADLQHTLAAGVYKTWFARTVFISGSEDEFLIGCPNKMVVDQLNEKYRQPLEKSAFQITAHHIDFRFIILKAEPQDISSPLVAVLPDAEEIRNVNHPQSSPNQSMSRQSNSGAIAPTVLNPQNTLDQFAVG